MKLPNDYAQAPAGGYAQQPKLPAGGYICSIKSVGVGDRDGMPYLEVRFEIQEGEHMGYFARRYQNDQRSGKYEAQWRGVYRVNVLTREGATNPYFKGLVTAIEESNPGTVLTQNGVLMEDRMPRCLVGLLIGQYGIVSLKGRPYMRMDVRTAVSVKTIRAGDFTVPEPRFSDAYKAATEQGMCAAPAADYTPVDDSVKLPWES